MRPREFPSLPGRRRVLLLGAAAAGTAAAAAACVPDLPGRGPGPRTFRLTPKNTFPADLPRVAWSLVVAEPTAEQALDTTRIAVLTGGTAVDYVAQATWVDRAPAMVQALIVQSFQGSGAVAAVGTDRDRLRAQYLLRSELRAFQLNRGGDGAGTARVRLDPTLLRLPRRDLVGRTSLAAEVVPDAPGTDAAIAAFDTALGKVLRQLVTWTLQIGGNAAA